MPTVPYNPNIDVKADMGTPIPYQQINATPDDFGAQVGQALQRGGAEITAGADQLGASIIRQQNINNEASANDLDVKAMGEIGQLTDKFHQQEGINAVNAAPQYQKDIAALRDKYRGMAPNGAAAKMLDSLLTRRIGQAEEAGGTYAASQQKRYNNDAFDAKQTLSIQQAQGAKNDGDFQTYASAAVDAAKAKAQNAGASPEQTQLLVQDAKNSAFSGYIAQQSMTDPAKALDTLQKNQKNISPDVYGKLYNGIRSSAGNIASRNIADGITSSANPTDLETQFAYANHELGEGRYGDVGNRIKNASDPVEAAKDVTLHYEVPSGAQTGDVNKVPTWAKRRDATLRIFNGNGSQDEMAGQAYFMKQGYTKAAASAIVGNFAIESGLKPSAINRGDGSDGSDSIGIGQWNGTRAANLKAFAQKYNPQGLTFSGGNQGMGVEKMEAVARAQAQAQFSHDAEMAQIVADQSAARVRANYNLQKSAAEDTIRNNFNDLNAQVYPVNGTPPTNKDELFGGDPAKQAKYESLPPAQRQAIDRALEGNSENKNVPLSAENIQHMQKYRWMAERDPDGFKNLDVAADKTLTRSQRNQVAQWQANPPKAPNTAHEIGVQMAPQLHALKLDQRSNPAAYATYMGAVAQQVELEETKKGDRLNQQEKTRIGQDLLRNIVVPHTLWFNGQQRAYEQYSQGPSDKDRSDIIEQYKSKYGTTPAEDIIGMIYHNKIAHPNWKGQ